MGKGLPAVLPYQEPNASELVLIKTNIAGYFFDAVLDVTHSQKTNITSHPVQTGANVTDHAFLEPARLTMTIKMSDTKVSTIPSQFAGIAYTKSVGAYRILEQLQQQRLSFQVHTRLKTYQNMMIESLDIQDSLETLYGLEVTIEMVEILVASEKIVKISKRVQATDSSSVGAINGSAVNESLLYQLLGGRQN